MVNVGILGYGTVGSGVVEVIATNQESINKKAGKEVHIKYVLDIKDFPGDPIQEKIVHDVNIILDDPEINVVVEVMGGVEPAYTFVKKALLSGKSVVTSNKALVAKHGAELLEIARDNKLNFLFEASVGGGIPIIRPMNQSLTADEIKEISGILNGTTNYILTKMDKEGLVFDEVLKDAQEKGYAERNPEADIEGYDACRKIAILSSLAFGFQVDFEDIHTEGITEISAMDFRYAEKLNRSIKLLGLSRKTEQNKIYAIVAPFMISPEHALYPVSGVINGIHLVGNMVGDVTFIGAGAGKLPTASAVVTDIIDCAKHLGTSIMTFWSREKLELSDYTAAEYKFYIRIQGDKNKRLPEFEAALGNLQVVELDGVTDEFAVVTDVMVEGRLDEALDKADGVLGKIRML